MPYKEQEEFELSEWKYITAFSEFIVTLGNVCCAFIWICALVLLMKVEIKNILLFFIPICILALIATLGCLYTFSYIAAKIEEKRATKIRQKGVKIKYERNETEAD